MSAETEESQVPDVRQVIDTLQSALLSRYGDDVDLLFQYGSHLSGTTHKYSDVDLSWVPAHDDTWGSITVMVDETLFDLYPMHWAHLERMADCRDVSSSVLLSSRLLYQRTGAAGERFAALAARLRSLQEPAARPVMVRRALEIFQSTGYEYYLLREQAAAGQVAGTLKAAQAILRTVLHCLAVCNQACIDTRKLAQVLALPRLPAGFPATVDRVVAAMAPPEALDAIDALLATTRDLLLAEQRAVERGEASYADAFAAGYPELKRELQAILLACEQANLFAAKGAVLSLLHEMSRGIAQVVTGVEATPFNALADYAQELTALGFPALLAPLVEGDFATLGQRCYLFDQRLQAFFHENGVGLNNFATLDELQHFLRPSPLCG